MSARGALGVTGNDVGAPLDVRGQRPPHHFACPRPKISAQSEDILRSRARSG